MAGDENMSAQEIQLRDCFAKFDSNGDGRIQADEFKKLMSSLADFTPKEIKRLFKEADTDGSNSVDWKEFLSWILNGTALKGMGAKGAASFERLLNTETQDEASFVESAQMGHNVTEYLRQAGSKDKKPRQRKRTAQKAACDDLGVPSDWGGHRIQLPMTPDGARQLLDHFLHSGAKSPLHAKHVTHIITQFVSAYSVRHPKPVVYTDVPQPDGRLIIVGDTHGQLADVLHILYHLGPPSAQNRYLFNGDMVDRGSQGVEILLILFAFFLADPESVIVHRGNHENEDMNALHADNGGGFEDEVMEKYGLSVYRHFVSSFKVMSLASVINKEIFVVHGGLTRVKNLTVDYINTLPFQDYTAPHPMSSNVKEQLFSDLLWSDPTEHEGKYKSDRGVGIKYGPDVTTKFCSQNRLRFLVRSHQVPEDGRGFQKQHNDRCVTVFSASNYCGDGGNFGAVIVLSAANFPRYEVFEHFAAPLDEMPSIVAQGDSVDWNKTSTSQQRDSLEASRVARQEKTFARMIISIIEKKPQLWSYIIRNSVGQKMPTDEFVQMMEAQIESDNPWKEALEEWGVIQDGQIEVTKFLNKWVVKSESAGYSSFVNDAIKQVYEAIVAMDMDLTETFKMFDKDGDGTVDIKEAKQVLEKFNLGLSSSQIDRLLGQLFATSVVAADSVRLSVQEFLGHFTTVYSATNNADLPRWCLDTLGQIGRLIIKTKAPGAGDGESGDATKMSQVFQEIDTSGDGILQLDEFVAGIEKLPGLDKLIVDGECLSHQKLVDISKILDVTQDGTLNYLEFQQAFQLKGQGTADLENSLVEDLTTLLFRYRVHIRTGCQFLDEVDSCKVLSEDFENVLRGVNSALHSNEQGISESQIKHLSSALTVEDIGRKCCSAVAILAVNSDENCVLMVSHVDDVC
ncbi:ppt1 [Symbiodinium necroappetens]|uniref:Ppt1 protein n=1 Tax=Symbiodinium necroappetens TaxID=1628268 RepID=A0A812N5I9_9DINO|nr:ppt1 [Symbiodinium necroappetens]